MKKIILIKEFEGIEGSDKVTISFDDFHYSLTCSYVKEGKSYIYLRDRKPDCNNMWALLNAKLYKNEGYKIIQGGEYLFF